MEIKNFFSASIKNIFWTVSVAAIIFGIFFIIVRFGDYRVEKFEKEASLESQIGIQNESLDKLKKEFNQFKLENQETSINIFEELVDIKKELGLGVQDLQKKLEEERAKRILAEAERKAEELSAQQKISELEKSVAKISSFDLITIINQWRPKLASVSCYFGDSDKLGSGIAINFTSFGISILTNKHVIFDDSAGMPDFCNIKLAGDGGNFINSAKDISFSAKGYDWGIIKINNQSQYLTNVTAVSPVFCQKEDTSIGDQIVVLGYPLIGAIGDVTATEGIISGYDGDYYITSAKVDQGNSGGAVVLLKKNCLLGIPTWAKLGAVESLARILDIQTVFK